MLQQHSPLEWTDLKDVTDLRKAEGGERQANPTSAGAVEAAVQGLENNYSTFKDRRKGGDQAGTEMKQEASLLSYLIHSCVKDGLPLRSFHIQRLCVPAFSLCLLARGRGSWRLLTVVCVSDTQWG